MTALFLSWLTGLIAAGDVHLFYVSTEWMSIRAEVLRLDRGECQICKARHRIRFAELVHHVNHVKVRPDLALDIWYTDSDGNRKRNLISVCKVCHETVCHPERLRRRAAAPKGFTSPERWD